MMVPVATLLAGVGLGALMLGSMPMPAIPQDASCAPVAGIEDVLGEGRVLLLGEIHGTEEGPGFAAAVACHALARELAVTVALELPTREEPAVQGFLRSPGGERGEAAIVGLAFWSKSYQDGRSSRAMLALIEQARSWKSADQDIEVILLDDPTGDRDRHMADRLLDAIAAAPERVFVALTGNLHNRTAVGSSRMGARVSRALGSARVSSLNMAHAGGAAWFCEASQGCGPIRLAPRDAPNPGQITLHADPRGYDGTYSVGALTPSPPAANSKVELDE